MPTKDDGVKAALAIESAHGGDNAAVALQGGQVMLRVDIPSSEVNDAQSTAAQYGFRLQAKIGPGARWRDRYVFVADGGGF